MEATPCSSSLGNCSTTDNQPQGATIESEFFNARPNPTCSKINAACTKSYRNQTEVPFGEIATEEFEAWDRAKPSMDLVEIPLINIYSNDLLRGYGVNLFQAVATRYPQHRDTVRITAIESTLEEFR